MLFNVFHAQKRALTFAFITGLALTPAVVFADPGHGRGGGHDYHDHYDRGHDRHHRGPDRVVINDYNRVIIRNYIVEDYHTHCPPGLAKKHNGCVPPGHAKRYYIGRPLPADIVYIPVSGPLLMQLEPAPVGYQYVQVDKDVLLISEASKNVIDAVTLLSAVGN